MATAATITSSRADVDPRVHVLDGALDSRRLATLRPDELAADGARVLRVRSPVLLGVDDEFDVRFARLLREGQAACLHVDWAAAGRRRWPVEAVRHLQPPRAGDDAWVDAFRFGSCYYRVGPDFILIRDVRLGTSQAARYLVDDAESVASWPELEGALCRTDATSGGLTLLEMLADENLVLAADDWATLAPARMRRWPVPEWSI